MFVLSIVLPAALSTGQTQNFIINRRLGAINILRNKKGWGVERKKINTQKREICTQTKVTLDNLEKLG